MDVSGGVFAINSSDAFFLSSQSNGPQGLIDGVSKQGGTAFPVVTQYVQSPSNALAADNSTLYYLSLNTNTMGGQGCMTIAASPAAPLDGGAPSYRVVGHSSSSCMTPNSMAVFGPTLFVGMPTNGNQYVVSSVPTNGNGASLSTVATFANANAVAIDSSNVYAIVTPNGPCEIDSAPSAGGGSTSTFVNGNALNSVGGGCPSAIASDGTTVYWAGNYSRNLSNNNGGDQVCILFVGAASASMPVPTLRSSVEVNEAPLKMVTDGTNAYVLTNDSLWRFPTDTGAPPVRVAGNLGITVCGGGMSGGNGGCSFPGGGCGQSSDIGLAVDDTSVYVAIGNTQGGNQGGVLYKIPK
jgi:hypothetical protein